MVKCCTTNDCVSAGYVHDNTCHDGTVPISAGRTSILGCDLRCYNCDNNACSGCSGSGGGTVPPAPPGGFYECCVTYAQWLKYESLLPNSMCNPFPAKGDGGEWLDSPNEHFIEGYVDAEVDVARILAAAAGRLSGRPRGLHAPPGRRSSRRSAARARRG